MGSKDYGDSFHQLHLKNSMNSADEIVPILFNLYKPKSVLDVGCGIGTWLRIVEKYDCDIFGIDGDYINTKNLLIDVKKFQSFDLNQNLDLGRRFDLTISLEVAEHILPKNAKTFVDNLCFHSDIVLFSAAIKGQGGTYHYNEQSNQYWVDMFEENGYECIDFLRHDIWHNQRISWWYRQNILIFIKTSVIKDEKFKKLVERKNSQLNTYVHPELLKLKSKKIETLELILSNPLRVLKFYLGKLKPKFK